MAEEVKADREQLTGMAGALRDSTSELDSSAKTDPPMPEVSVSADKVGHTLSELTKTVGGLVAAVHQTADKIHASSGSYGEVDNHAADELRRSGSGLGY